MHLSPIDLSSPWYFFVLLVAACGGFLYHIATREKREARRIAHWTACMSKDGHADLAQLAVSTYETLKRVARADRGRKVPIKHSCERILRRMKLTTTQYAFLAEVASLADDMELRQVVFEFEA